MMKRPVFFLLIILIVFSSVGIAQDKVMTQEQILERGTQLIENKQYDQAVEFLKSGQKEFAHSGPIARLLAKAYLKQGNEPWALRTLNAHAAKTGDCETITWIAWFKLQAGELDDGLSVLEQGKCEDGTPAATRAMLLKSALLKLKEDPQNASAQLALARKQAGRFVEDGALFDFADSMVDPGRITPIRLKAKAAFGYNSNALQSSIAEDQAEEVGSFTNKLEGELDFVWPLSTYVRPELRGYGKIQNFDDKDAQDVGYRQFGGKAGFLLGNLRPRAGLYYANDNLVLVGGDDYDAGPRWFSEAHRGEVEFEPLSWLMIFGGGGKRWFRERARTRYEGDLGIAGTARMPKRISVSLALSGRMYDGQVEGYDQNGGSALIMAQFPYYKDGSFSLGALGSLDDYHNSEDFFEIGETRQDQLARGIANLWSPSLWGIQYGLTYKATKRDSTIEDYAYTAHEVFVTLSWRKGFDPWRPMPRRDDLHVKLDYGFSQNTLAQQRLQDLLREEDAARQSSSCVD